jgi:hypothetical protein
MSRLRRGSPDVDLAIAFGRSDLDQIAKKLQRQIDSPLSTPRDRETARKLLAMVEAAQAKERGTP